MAVLILIVVEDGLVPTVHKFAVKTEAGLNPYCSGRWSRTFLVKQLKIGIMQVLILIVVEDGLVHLTPHDIVMNDGTVS